MDIDAATADPERRFERLGNAAAIGATDPQPVLDDLETVALARVDARVALLLEQLEHLVLGEVRPAPRPER